MTSFAFTGKAIVNGLHFERKLLFALAKERGHTVHKHVRKGAGHTNYLVSDHEVGEAVGYATKKLAVYMTSVNTLRISTERFLEKMEVL